MRHRGSERGEGSRAALLVTAALVIGLSLAAVPQSSAIAGDPGPCALPRLKGETVHNHVKRLIHCSTNHWHVFGGYDKALCIARRESGLNPKAVSSDGKYLGLYQHYKRYWPGRYATYSKRAWQLPESALVGRTAAVVSIRMAHAVGWDPWRGKGCAVKHRH